MISEICHPKVSVIIPMYKVEDCLSMCLDSCINQSLFDIEIICVDDGSPDQSGEIADHYAETDSRITVIHKENGGLSSARNAGLAVATGDMIMFLDSDDYLATWACARIWEETLQRPADIVVFGSDVFPAYPKPEKWLWWTLSTRMSYYPSFKPDALFKETGAIPFVWRQAYSRWLLERSGVVFDESVRYGEDVIFQLEIFPYANHISFIPDRAYYYRFDRPGSLMSVEKKDPDARLQKHIAVVEKTADFWKNNGFMQKYGPDYLDWCLEYIVSDLKKYEYKDVRSLSQSFLNLLDQKHLMQYKDSISSNGRKRLKHLQQLIRD